MGVYFIYMVQLGYYVHATYATVYLDQWRKDSLVMIFHHIVCITLLVFSFVPRFDTFHIRVYIYIFITKCSLQECLFEFRYYKIGILSSFLHDVSDVFLETSKCLSYARVRGGVKHKLNNHLCALGFLAFATSW